MPVLTPASMLNNSYIVRAGRTRVWPRRFAIVGQARGKNPLVAAATLRNLPIGVASPRSSDKWFKEIIQTLISRIDLCEEDAEASLDFLVRETDQALIGSFLVLLGAKGVTYKEILGLAKSFNKSAGNFCHLDHGIGVVGLDCTDEASGYISIGASVLAAAAGAKVIQKGTYDADSFYCGKEAVLEAMGVAIGLDNEGVKNCVKEVGIGFVMPPKHHQAMEILQPAREKLKVKTVIDILGPLLNPTPLSFAVVRVCSEDLVIKMAKALQRTGLERALILHSNSMDVLSPHGPGLAVDVTPGNINKFTLDPLDFGILRCNMERLKKGGPEDTAKLLRDILSGEKGAVADTIILNAAAALWVSGCVSSVGDGVALAREAHISRKASRTLDSWIDISNAQKQRLLSK